MGSPQGDDEPLSKTSLLISSVSSQRFCLITQQEWALQVLVSGGYCYVFLNFFSPLGQILDGFLSRLQKIEESYAKLLTDLSLQVFSWAQLDFIFWRVYFVIILKSMANLRRALVWKHAIWVLLCKPSIVLMKPRCLLCRLPFSMLFNNHENIGDVRWTEKIGWWSSDAALGW